MAVVGHNFVQAALVRRGEANLQALKDAWWQTQQGKCAKCLYIPTSKLGGAPQDAGSRRRKRKRNRLSLRVLLRRRDNWDDNESLMMIIWTPPVDFAHLLNEVGLRSGIRAQILTTLACVT